MQIFSRIRFLANSMFMLGAVGLMAIILTSQMAIAEANFVIKDWREYARITETGKASTAIMTGNVQNLPAGYTLKSYSISFPKTRTINVLEVKIDNKLVNYIFNKNELLINFSRGRNNRETIEISFTYEESNLKANQGIRQETIAVPPIAKDASVFFAFDYGDSLEIISGLEDLKLKNGVAVYTGKVPEQGLLKVLKFTNKRDGWDIKITNSVYFQGLEGEMEVTLPNLFENGGQKILDNSSRSSLRPEATKVENGYKIMNFVITPDINKIMIENKAKILTGESFRSRIVNNGNNSMTYVSETDSELLRPILENIKSDPQYQGLPLHAKIVKFVNSFIKYDYGYYGKLLNIRDIIKEKKGVCSEFATLYNGLARLAGIPSSIVYGYSLGEYDKFEPHAWNMSQVNNQWIQIDPTWNLSSGAVSSSHIYLKNDASEDIVVKFRGKGQDNIKLEKIIDIKSMRDKR